MGEAFIVNKNKKIIEDSTAAPSYEFTGDSEWIWDSDVNWRLKMTSSGTLTFTSLGSAKTIDVFCVGAGGGVPSGNGHGGGGGYTITQKSITVEKNKAYTITVGTGSVGANGGYSSAFGVKAAGGYAASSTKGGNGGSGGGGYNWYNWNSGANAKGGSDGGNGYCPANSSKIGKGQKSVAGPNGETGTTREFGETSGTLYAGGGGAVYTIGENATYTSQAGGSGGGGKSGSGGSGNYAAAPAGTNGTNGLGGGGGSSNTRGGSGIVIIRNARG